MSRITQMNHRFKQRVHELQHTSPDAHTVFGRLDPLYSTLINECIHYSTMLYDIIMDCIEFQLRQQFDISYTMVDQRCFVGQLQLEADTLLLITSQYKSCIMKHQSYHILYQKKNELIENKLNKLQNLLSQHTADYTAQDNSNNNNGSEDNDDIVDIPDHRVAISNSAVPLINNNNDITINASNNQFHQHNTPSSTLAMHSKHTTLQHDVGSDTVGDSEHKPWITTVPENIEQLFDTLVQDNVSYYYDKVVDELRHIPLHHNHAWDINQLCVLHYCVNHMRSIIPNRTQRIRFAAYQLNKYGYNKSIQSAYSRIQYLDRQSGMLVEVCGSRLRNKHRKNDYSLNDQPTTSSADSTPININKRQRQSFIDTTLITNTTVTSNDATSDSIKNNQFDFTPYLVHDRTYFEYLLHALRDKIIIPDVARANLGCWSGIEMCILMWASSPAAHKRQFLLRDMYDICIAQLKLFGYTRSGKACKSMHYQRLERNTYEIQPYDCNINYADELNKLIDRQDNIGDTMQPEDTIITGTFEVDDTTTSTNDITIPSDESSSIHMITATDNSDSQSNPHIHI